MLLALIGDSKLIGQHGQLNTRVVRYEGRQSQRTPQTSAVMKTTATTMVLARIGRLHADAFRKSTQVLTGGYGEAHRASLASDVSHVGCDGACTDRDAIDVQRRPRTRHRAVRSEGGEAHWAPRVP
jgi:hypothetical protein